MKIGNHHIKLDPTITQVSPSNRNYKVIGIEKDLTQPPKWFDNLKDYKYFWIVTVRYENEEKDRFTFDYQDKCIKKETIKIE